MKILKYILALALVINILPFASVSAANADIAVKGFWVATVYQINYPEKNTTDPELLKAYADEILNNAASLGFNTVFLQVRPTADAFYYSNYFKD